jgi:hypothetical protein
LGAEGTEWLNAALSFIRLAKQSLEPDRPKSIPVREVACTICDPDKNSADEEASVPMYVYSTHNVLCRPAGLGAHSGVAKFQPSET